ncbi:MAG: YncE family protein [Myxococcales bacterium]|nr:YncE family protein [Myxococcales bacterium]
MQKRVGGVQPQTSVPSPNPGKIPMKAMHTIMTALTQTAFTRSPSLAGTARGALVLTLAALPMLAGCPATSDEVRPPDDQFFFPTGMAIDGDEGSLFVTNANSDLRYDSGSIVVVDLERVKELAASWLNGGQVPAGADCEIDSTIATTLVCNEAEVIVADSTVRTGNFATEIGVQALDDGSARVFAAVRGDPSLTWLDFDPASRELECGGSGAMPRCNQEHRLTRLRDDESIGNLPAEPFGLYVDSADGFVIMTHLTQGAVSLADAPTDGSPPVISDALGGVFDTDPSTGARSALGAAARLPGGRVYVTSRSEERVQIFTVARIGASPPALVPSDYFFLRDVLPSDDARGIRFNEEGTVAYVVNRDPAVLQVLDTSLDAAGQPKNTLKQVIEICSNASNLTVGDLGAGEKVYVACFREGQVWVVDPIGGGVDAIVDVGRGPQAIAISEEKEQLYVTNFLEDTVAVVDLTLASPTENRVVLKLGRTRQSGGK